MRKREELLDITWITVVWLISVAIVNPVGDFPLNDDFAYGRTVEHLLATGDYRPHPWPWAPMVTNILWGTLFCLPVGFGFTALRISTLVAAWLGIVGCYILIRDNEGSRSAAILLACTLGFNPIYYACSHTFMTDVPFTVLSVWSAVFFCRSIKSGAIQPFVTGTALALAATLSRQVALCIPLALLCVHATAGRRRPDMALRSAIALVACAGGFALFKYWLTSTGRSPSLVDTKTGQLLQTLASPKAMLTVVPDHLFIAAMYLGLFLLPILLIAPTGFVRSVSRMQWLLSAAGLLILVAGFVAHANSENAFGPNSLLMPVGYNVLQAAGIGPVMLRDVYFLKLAHFPPLPLEFWTVVTCISAGGATLLICRLCGSLLNLFEVLRSAVPTDTSGARDAFILISALVYLAPVVLSTDSYDRNLLPLLPFVGLIIARAPGYGLLVVGDSIWARRAAVALSGAIALFAVAVTHDYLEWNRLRWTGLGFLQNELHAAALDVDGGFEFNGLYLFDPKKDLDRDCAPAAVLIRSCWWVAGDTYQIAFGDVPGYERLREYSYHHWLPPHVQQVVVLRRCQASAVVRLR